MADLIIKQGDTSPTLTATLTNTDGTTVNLAGATVKFVMRPLTSNTPTVNASGTVTSTTNPANVSYTWTAQDTNTPGRYTGSFVVTFSDATIQTFPTIGYLSITVEDNLTTAGGARLVDLSEVKEHLRIPATDRTHDSRLEQMIDSVVPVVEQITGPILQRSYQNETYDGGSWFISLRHRPVLSVDSVTEYRGPIPYALTQVAHPDLGTIYSYMFEPPGRIVRRTVGGGTTLFPPGPDQVWVTYTAGFLQVPKNVREATLELIRVNYQATEQGPPRMGGAGDPDDELRGVMTGFFVPGRVRELLEPNRRHPSVA